MPEELAPQVEAALLAAWRRILREGGGPELTLAEAATLLGSSVDTVRRRIRAGQILAFHDDRGRVRVSASVTYTPARHADDESVSRVWAELKTARDQLEAAMAEKTRLASELDAAEKALEYTKNELANLWQAMTTRNLKRTAPPDPARERPRIIDFTQERSRIQAKVADVRMLARRRRWPWISLVG